MQAIKRKRGPTLDQLPVCMSGGSKNSKCSPYQLNESVRFTTATHISCSMFEGSNLILTVTVISDLDLFQTYRKDAESNLLSYDLHFWLGKDTSQDEAGTAAYKTVELDDRAYRYLHSGEPGWMFIGKKHHPYILPSDLHGLPVQYREIQGYESARFLSYFPQFVCLRGGVSTGFHHVSAPPPLNVYKLYKISLPGRSKLVVREVPAEATSLVEGDVFVLDKGTQLWQFNTKTCAGKERFEARQFVEKIANDRRQEHTQVDITVYGTPFFSLRAAQHR